MFVALPLNPQIFHEILASYLGLPPICLNIALESVVVGIPNEIYAYRFDDVVNCGKIVSKTQIRVSCYPDVAIIINYGWVVSDPPLR